MANDEVKQLILGWCGTGDDLQVVLDGFYTVEDRSEPDTDVALALKSASGDLVASLQSGSDRLVLRQATVLGATSAAGTAPAGNLADALQEIEDRSPGPVTVALDPSSERTVVLSTWVILDGLTKHTFLTAVSDLERTRRVVARLAGPDATAATTSAFALPAQAMPAQAVPAPVQTPTPSSSETAEPSPAAGAAGSPSFGSVFQPSPAGYGATQASPTPAAYTPSYPAQGYQQAYTSTPAATPTPTPTPSPAPSQAGWAPSHKVPPQGMQAWAAPDPNGAVVATLGGHLPVQVTEMRGAWAHVVCSNGWTGWVDGRLLVSGA
jgi:hypothetical protein